MLDFAFNLKALGVPFQTVDQSERRSVPDEDIKPILTPRNQFDLLKYDHILEMFSAPLPDDQPVRRSHVILWEFESGLIEYDSTLDKHIYPRHLIPDNRIREREPTWALLRGDKINLVTIFFAPNFTIRRIKS